MSLEWGQSFDDFDGVITGVVVSAGNPFGKVLEFTWVNWSLSSSLLVADWSEVNENIVLSWDQVFSSEFTLKYLSHFLWVISLGSKVEIVIFTSRLHNNNNVVIKTIVLSDQVGVSHITGGSSIWLVIGSGNSVLAVPRGGAGSWHQLIELMDLGHGGS